MTTFEQDDTGLDSSNPIELYRFYGIDGSYTYTSGNRQMSYAAPSSESTEVYKPIPMSRSEVVLGDVTEKNQLTITIPKNLSLVNDYVFDISPCDDLLLEIYRLNGSTGAIQLIFYGIVASFNVQDNKVTVVCPSTFTNYLQTDFPNIYYQSACNHVLYDNGCTVNRADFLVLANIMTVSADGLTITFEETSGPISGYGSLSNTVKTLTYGGITYDYSDTEEWDTYLANYPDVVEAAIKAIAADTVHFPTQEAYAAWHWLKFGRYEGRIAPVPTLFNSELPDAWLTPGEIVIGSERRLILQQVGTSIMLNYPFRAINVGDAVEMAAGCLHTSDACREKFNNGDNFLGFEFIPYINPFLVGVQ
jgi:hypothetical protein